LVVGQRVGTVGRFRLDQMDQDAGTLDVAAVVGVLASLLGGDDPRIARLLSL